MFLLMEPKLAFIAKSKEDENDLKSMPGKFGHRKDRGGPCPLWWRP